MIGKFPVAVLLSACAGAKPVVMPPLARIPSPFPVIYVDSAVRARLSEEWSSDNRYQHERSYCVRYTATDYPPTIFRKTAFVVYELTGITRAPETLNRQSSVVSDCGKDPDVTYLHIHPPFYCTIPEKGDTCSPWDQLAHQCFPSDRDVRFLLWTNRPVAFIQCDQWAIVPYFRKFYEVD